MKKIMLILCIFLFIPACSNSQNNEIIDNQEEEKLNININTNKYINPTKIGLYQDNMLVKSYQVTLANHKDIGVFNIYYTNNEILDNSNIKYNWNKYYSEYEDIDKYKIGFYIEFEVKNEKIEQTILDPSSKHIMDPYLYVYLYDDIHQQDGSWYSHLEEEDMNNDTIFSSIKLYLAGKGSEITSSIELTVFTYNKDTLDEFDDNGKYIGTNKYSIEIETIKN